MRRRPYVYIAGPLFNAGERSLNQAIKGALSGSADVYLPQTDGSLLEEQIKSGADPATASKAVFRLDIEAIERCDAILVVLNGRSVDEGAAFELGVAWAMGKTCVAFKDDPRQLLATGDNPMIAHAVEAVLNDLDGVAKWALALKQ